MINLLIVVDAGVTQLEVLKRKVDRTATELESVRAQIKQMKHDIISKQHRFIYLHHLQLRVVYLFMSSAAGATCW